MRVRIQHTTRYRYDQSAALGPHIVRLRPAEHARAKLLAYNLAVEPGAETRWQYDPWGNHVARLTFASGLSAESLTLTVDAAFEVRPVNPFDFFIDDRCQKVPFAYPDGLERELAPFLETASPGERLAAWLKDIPAQGYVTDHLVALNAKVARDVRYIIRNEPGIQSSEETLSLGSGSCRDSARLLCDALRAQGLAARFVSGYLIQLTDEGNLPDEVRGVDRDVVDLHAWCEVFIPGAGWIGLDGTSGLLCNEGHIPLACVVNPELAAPVDGTASVAASGFDFTMQVERLGHEPRPRKPYTDAQWDALRAKGDEVDTALRDAKLSLTMGGEPTFTSRLHPREPEWNGDALGATKWTQGLRLARELARRFGRGPLVMRRMGKLYPGESLPRWVLHLLWREDDVPVWRDARWLDLGGEARAVSVDLSRVFLEALARRLGLTGEVIAAHEDPWVFVTQEENLPADIDPLAADLDLPESRRTLARVLGRGLGEPVGYVLPLGRRDDHWVTSTWAFRRGHLFLLPGDSPLGLRLPLDRVSGTADEVPVEDVTLPQPVFTFDPREVSSTSPRPQHDTHLAAGSVRTALCVEARDAALHVFLPPLPSAGDFLALIAHIEDVARELEAPVMIEGYAPPNDPRLRQCLVTPDPGVIEVNVPVTSSMRDYVAMMETISDAALHAGLSTEKYQLDGREVGSGGGHHLTLGGPTTVESPFLVRPDLLASVLTFVQAHPSLSYLFTGVFVGATSQAPRVDEARHDSLYELDLALAQARAGARPPPPWLTDRIFRNLLVDVSGSTHRTEISIDKLYDPASLHGRQGIIEFRAFEMPPHERMAVAQMLLVRAMVAAFAREPFAHPLTRWGQSLHDRFMLPHYLWRDFAGVLDALAQRGVALDAEWYRPFVDYRFPVMGTLRVDDIALEIRPALEPWPVLGEEASMAGTTRYVDSSLERVQVRAEGLIEGRHVVLVNGHALPLHATGRALESVAGVRFRAWQPPHCLQPTIGVHHPLRFDVVDLWGRRSLGAATYHVWHPEGRAFDRVPLTAFEAGARRAQRFTTVGHLPWPVIPIATSAHPEQPCTLDLRRYPAAAAR